MPCREKEKDNESRREKLTSPPQAIVKDVGGLLVKKRGYQKKRKITSLGKSEARKGSGSNYI